MILTKILVVRCDGCSKEDIFNAVRTVFGECLTVPREELEKEGWTLVTKDDDGNNRNQYLHLCRSCIK